MDDCVQKARRGGGRRVGGRRVVLGDMGGREDDTYLERQVYLLLRWDY